MTMISTTMGKNSLEEMEKSESEVAQSCPTLCDPMDCSLAGSSIRPWDFPGKRTGVGCHFLLQGIFPAQELNLGLPHCRQTLLPSELTGFENQVSKQSCLVRLVAICSELKPKTADSYSTALSILPCGLLQDHLEGK